MEPRSPASLKRNLKSGKGIAENLYKRVGIINNVIQINFMKKIRLIVTCLVFALGITGVIVAKANENKLRASTASNLYYDDDASGSAILLQANSNAKFKIDDSGDPAYIFGKDGTQYFLYEDASHSKEIYFNP
jgi:hypothetical protein